MSLVDAVYIAASASDARHTRICVASVRHFCPAVPVRLLAGSALQRRLVSELRQHWNVHLADLPVGDYGWGFVKLEPLFGPPGERFLVLDSDTVLTGRMLEHWAGSDAPFLVDDEEQTDTNARRLYYDWEALRQVDREIGRPPFLFNSGQWFGTAGLITRKDFSAVMEWTMPRSVRYPSQLMCGEQGVLNYVIHRKIARDGLRVDRRPLMRWPGHSMNGITAATIAAGTAPAVIVHWAGMKRTHLQKIVGGDVLMHFEDIYYRQTPGGFVRRVLNNSQHVWRQWRHHVAVRLALRYQKWVCSRSMRALSSGANLR